MLLSTLQRRVCIAFALRAVNARLVFGCRHDWFVSVEARVGAVTMLFPLLRHRHPRDDLVNWRVVRTRCTLERIHESQPVGWLAVTLVLPLINAVVATRVVLVMVSVGHVLCRSACTTDV